MKKLSVVVSAYNEEKNIEDCLTSVAWADEIILVDNSSVDKTAKIAKKFTNRIFTRPNYPMLNINKNFGFLKATSEWILSLDADERVTKELKEEMIKATDYKVNGFWIPRKNIIFGKWIRHTGWYPDYQLRLFKRGKGKFPEKHIHEMVKVKGKTAKLKNPLLHYNYQTVSQFIYKLDRIYTENEAENLIKSGYYPKWQDALRIPAQEFLRRFFTQEGYKDGVHGLVLSMLMAFYHLIVFAKVWEKQGFKDGEEKFLEKTTQEFKGLGGEFRYWLVQAKLKTEKNLFKRVLTRFAKMI